MTTTTKTQDATPNLDDLLGNPFGDTQFSAPTVQPTQSNQVAEETKKKELTVFDTLPDDQKEQATKLSLMLDETKAQGILDFGSNAQKQLGNFSQSLLNQVKVQDTGEIGDVLSELMFKLEEADPKELTADSKNIFKKMFSKVKKNVYDMTAKYQTIGTQIDKIAIQLESEKNSLVKDNQNLEELYVQNKTYFDALNIFIAAAEIKIEEVLLKDIPEAVKIAETSTNQMDVQRVNDLNQFLNRLEKRSYDLKLARQISIQQAPQIRMIQNTNQVLAEKIQSSINTAIPLWKNQVVISLSLLRQQGAIKAQRQVSQTTNDLLLRNSEMLKMSTIETAKENERGVVDIETLQKTQTDLIDTLQETLSIQKEGRVKRKEAERELMQMEETLKQSLLQITTEE